MFLLGSHKLKIVDLINRQTSSTFCSSDIYMGSQICLFVLGCWTPPSTNIQFCWWRKPEELEKTTDLSQVIDKLYHIMLYTSPWPRFELTTSVMIDTDFIGSCKCNYHRITATTDPELRYGRWLLIFILINKKKICILCLNI